MHACAPIISIFMIIHVSLLRFGIEEMLLYRLSVSVIKMLLLSGSAVASGDGSYLGIVL